MRGRIEKRMEYLKTDDTSQPVFFVEEQFEIRLNEGEKHFVRALRSRDHPGQD